MTVCMSGWRERCQIIPHTCDGQFPDGWAVVCGRFFLNILDWIETSGVSPLTEFVPVYTSEQQAKQALAMASAPPEMPEPSAPPPPAPAAPQAVTNPLVKTTDAIAAIDIDNASPEQLVEAMSFTNWLKAKVREIDAMFEERAIAWISKNGDIVVGETRYYVGKVTHHKSADHKATTGAILRMADGDLDKLTECISSDGFKPGACRSVLGDELFAQVFTTIVRSDLKTGKPLRKLQSTRIR